MANFRRRSLLESSQQQNPDAHLSPLHRDDQDNQNDMKFVMTVATGGQEFFFLQLYNFSGNNVFPYKIWVEMCNLFHLFGSFTHTFSPKQLIFTYSSQFQQKKKPKSLTLKFVLFYHKSKIVKIYAVCGNYLAMCVKYLAQKSCHVIFF